MGDLMSALQSANLIPEERLKAEEQRRSETAAKKARKQHASLESDGSTSELDTATTIQQFRAAAKRELLGGTATIGTVIHKSHRFKKLLPLGKFNYFIRFFLELRNDLRGVPRTEHKELIKAAFRKEFR